MLSAIKMTHSLLAPVVPAPDDADLSMDIVNPVNAALPVADGPGGGHPGPDGAPQILQRPVWARDPVRRLSYRTTFHLTAPHLAIIFLA